MSSLDALAPVEVDVDWGDVRHRIAWRAGELVLEHHRDPAAEAAWVALGGARCPCLDVAEHWDEWCDDTTLLFRWAHPDMPVNSEFQAMTRMGVPMPIRPGPAVLEDLRRRRDMVHAQFASGPVPKGGKGHPQIPNLSPNERKRILAQFDEQFGRMWRDALVTCLPAELRDRLALRAVMRAVGNRDDERSWQAWRPAVERAISSRAVPALEESIRCWRGRAGTSTRSPTVEAWVTKRDEPLTLYGLIDKAGGWAAASLLDTWLVDVWAGPGRRRRLLRAGRHVVERGSSPA